MIPVLLATVTGLFAFAACAAEEERAPDWIETPEIQAGREEWRAACADWRQTVELDEVIRKGELGAIDCAVALEEWRFVSVSEPFDIDYFRLRSSFWRWQVSGERDERALAAARNMPRSDVALHTYLVREDEEHIGPPSLELLCQELNDIQLELVRVAIPDEESVPCLEGWGIAD